MPQGPPTDAIFKGPTSPQTTGGPPPDAVFQGGGGTDNPFNPETHGAPETSLGVFGTLKQYAHMPIDVYHAFTTPPQDETEKNLARSGGPAALGAKRLLYDPQKAEFMKAAKYQEKARTAT